MISEPACRVVDEVTAIVSFASTPRQSDTTTNARVDNVEIDGGEVVGVAALPPLTDLADLSPNALHALVPAPKDDFWEVEIDRRSALVVLRISAGDGSASVDGLDIIYVTGEPEYRQPVPLKVEWRGLSCTAELR